MFDKHLWTFLKEKNMSLCQFTLHDAFPSVTVEVLAKGNTHLLQKTVKWLPDYTFIISNNTPKYPLWHTGKKTYQYRAQVKLLEATFRIETESQSGPDFSHIHFKLDYERK